MSNALSLDQTKAAQDATQRALKGRLEEGELRAFVSAAVGAANPVTITATGSLYFAAIYGVVSCTPSKYPYKFEESAWGIGGTAITAGGIIYNAYKDGSWDAFFKNTTGYHAQGIADAGGIFQINFFHGSTPIGQFNAVAGGIGVFECGGNGKWHGK
jgi:hypothetical protein